MAQDAVYPLIQDWDAYLRGLAPTLIRAEPMWSIFRGCVSLFRDLDLTRAGIAESDDPEAASGFRLDQLGEQVGEPRGGLGDYEYQRIIAGRIVSTWARGTRSGLWRTWLALTGATEDTAALRRVRVSGDPCSEMTAIVAYPPSKSYLLRVGRVLADTVTVGETIAATVRLDTGAVWSDPSSLWGTATWAWQIPIPGQ